MQLAGREIAMTEQRRRRWFRFSLRGLLIGVAVASIWLGWQVHIVQEREAALAEVRAQRGQVLLFKARLVGARFFVRRAMGDEALIWLWYDPKKMAEAELSRVRAAFPEADIGTSNYELIRRHPFEQYELPPRLRPPH